MATAAVSHWGVSPDTRALVEDQLRLALPSIALSIGLVSALSEWIQNWIDPQRGFSPWAIGCYLGVAALGLFWLWKPLVSASLCAALLSAFVSSMVGEYVLRSGVNSSALIHFALVGVGTFYLVVDRRHQLFAQLVLLGWLFIDLVRWQEDAQALSIGTVCLVAWCGGLGLHVGRVRTLNHLVETQRALKRESKERLRAEAESLLAQKHESLGVMAGGVAHDFNNILVGIVGGLDLLERARANELEFAGALREVRQSSEAARELCRRLLTLAGGAPTPHTVIDLNRSLREGLGLGRLGLAPSIELIDKCFASPLPVRGDPLELRQLVVNLVANAVEALGDAGGSIEVSTFPSTMNGMESASIVVADDGPGVPEKIRGRIFDPFYTTKFAGRGLGLAVVGTTVRSHGGDIELDGSGGGARFEIKLPLSSEPSTIRESTTSASSLWQPWGELLVVDDDVHVARVARLLLEEMGFGVVVAESGMDAIREFEEQKGAFRAVLVDATMPGLDGPTTIQRLREIDPLIPALLCSGFSAGRERNRMELPSDVEFLAKPYNCADLEGALRRII